MRLRHRTGTWSRKPVRQTTAILREPVIPAAEMRISPATAMPAAEMRTSPATAMQETETRISLEMTQMSVEMMLRFPMAMPNWIWAMLPWKRRIPWDVFLRISCPKRKWKQSRPAAVFIQS